MEGSLGLNSVLGSRPEAAQVLGRLRLTAGKAAEICGVTRRQLCYWTDRGIIPCCSRGRGASRRLYDLAGLRKAILLKRLMDEGRGLRRAVRELKARWAQLPGGEQEAPGASDEQALLSQAERLVTLGQQARAVRAGAQKREALVRIALSLQPLAELSRAACEGRISLLSGERIQQLKSLLADAERAVRSGI